MATRRSPPTSASSSSLSTLCESHEGKSTSSPGVGHTVRPSINCLSLAPSVTWLGSGLGLGSGWG
eukprot:scaffold87907_cov60-Phaeocystis_antarctica.AAC.5